MTDPADSRALNERRLGWVTSIDRERGFAFIRGVDGEEYFCHARNFPVVFWRELQLQAPVSFQPVDTIKGWRGARLQPANDEEGRVIHDAQETAGNRS
jgi:cold shock CspA family protein